jgi:hypothetical protein
VSGKCNAQVPRVTEQEIGKCDAQHLSVRLKVCYYKRIHKAAMSIFIVVPSLHDVLCCLENTYTEMVLPRQENQHSLQAGIDASIQAASDHTVDVNAQVSDSI